MPSGEKRRQCLRKLLPLVFAQRLETLAYGLAVRLGETADEPPAVLGQADALDPAVVVILSSRDQPGSGQSLDGSSGGRHRQPEQPGQLVDSQVLLAVEEHEQRTHLGE